MFYPVKCTWAVKNCFSYDFFVYLFYVWWKFCMLLGASVCNKLYIEMVIIEQISVFK